IAIGELLDERGREPDRHLVRDAALPQVVEQAEQRKVRTEDRLVHPLLAVRPAARAAGVGQMGVEDEREGLGHSPIVAVGRGLGSARATRLGGVHVLRGFHAAGAAGWSPCPIPLTENADMRYEETALIAAPVPRFASRA